MKKFLQRRIGVAHDQSNHRPSLPDCLELVLTQADHLMDDVLEGLVAAAAKDKGQRSYGQHFSVSKTLADLLCLQADAVKMTFKAQLRQGLYNTGEAVFVRHSWLRFDDLQQLDTRQIDVSIELALAQQEVVRCVEDLLPAVDALVSSLLGWITVQAQLNPLKPDAFVRALQATLVQHVPDEQARAALVTPTAGLLGAGLHRLYLEVCDWLRSQGIEPASPVGAPSGGRFGAGKGSENSVTRTLVTLDRLRKLLSGEFDGTQGNPGLRDFLHTVPACYDALEDLKLIEPMMKRLAQRASLPAATKAPTEALDQTVEREPTQSQQLGQELGAEVVRLMLENLMHDERLLGKVRALIKTLEPTLLRLAQSDSRFFSERQHPARQFLDRLTHRSLAYTSENDEGFSLFLTSASEAVGVLCAGDGDAASFARVGSELEADWALEGIAQRQQQEEAARALLHAEHRNVLAQSLAVDFEERQKGKEIPDFVAAFLRGPWAQVVAESQLGCADGSTDPGGYLALVDELLWSVQYRWTRRNRLRLVQLVPNLLVKLRHGLQLIQYPQERLPALLDALITLHEKAFDASEVSADGDPAQGTTQTQGDRLEAEGLSDVPDMTETTEFWIADDQTTQSEHLADDAEHQAAEHQGASLAQHPWSAVDLNPGSWVELIVDDVWLRAQLTWASPQRTLFMFVSGGGVAHSMSRRTMDRLRMRGRVRFVSDGHVLDNALDAVARTALQNDLGRVEK